MDLINNGHVPTCVNIYRFEGWLNYFNSFIGMEFGLPVFPVRNSGKISIEFSIEEKQKRSGSMDISEIKRKIRDMWDLNERIESILDEIKSYSDYEGKAQGLAGWIAENNLDASYQGVRQEIDDLFDDIYYEYDILGEYSNCEKKIILYITNIEEHSRNNGIPLLELIEEVFVHELFHAYHYKDDDDEMTRRRDYTKQVVLESLASYFECRYCEEKGMIDAGRIVNESWYIHPVCSYPYSGAKYIHDTNTFVDIYKTSLEDMDLSLRHLVPCDEFYKIKNMARIRKRTKKKINIFKLNQSVNFEIETTKGYAFSPNTDRYKDMKNVREGDIAFSIFGGKLRAIGIAKRDCYLSTDSYDKGESGHYIDFVYFVFDTPIDITRFKKESCYQIKRNEPYIRPFNHPAFIRLLMDEAKKQMPNNSMMFTMIENLL